MALTVAVEGLPGVGKTTVIQLMVEEFRRRGFTVAVVDIETIGYAPDLREISRAYPLGHPARLLLFWILRLQQYEAMQKLAHMDIVFADRFIGSTLAYDAYGNGVPRGLVDWFGQHIKQQPDITFLFEAPLAVVRQRKKAKTMSDPCFAKRVEEGYQELADELSWIRIDATQEPEDVGQCCLAVICARL